MDAIDGRRKAPLWRRGWGGGTRLLTHSFPWTHTGTAAQKPEPRAETEGQETQSGLAGDMTVERGAGGG